MATRRKRTPKPAESTDAFPKITNADGAEVIPVVRHMRAVTISRELADKMRERYEEPRAGEETDKVRVILTNTNVRHLWNELSEEDKTLLLDPEHPSGKGPLVRLDVVPQ